MKYSFEQDNQRDEDRSSFIIFYVSPRGTMIQAHQKGHDRYKNHLLKEYGVKIYEVAREMARNTHQLEASKLDLVELEHKAISNKNFEWRFISTFIINVITLLVGVATFYFLVL